MKARPQIPGNYSDFLQFLRPSTCTSLRLMRPRLLYLLDPSQFAGLPLTKRECVPSCTFAGRMQVSPGHRPTGSTTSALSGVGVSPSTLTTSALHPAGLTASTSNATINHGQLDVPVISNAVAGPSTSPAPTSTARKDKKCVRSGHGLIDH